MSKARSKKTKTQSPPPPWPVPPYTALSSVTMLDTAVDQKLLPEGKPAPEVIVADLLDSYGRHCRRWGDDPAVLLDTVSDGNVRDG